MKIITSLKDKYYIKKNIYQSLDFLETKIQEIHKYSSTIAICPSATGNNWQGVQTATLGLFPNNTLIIPQYYSQLIYTKKELLQICSIIKKYNFENLVLSGPPLYFKEIINNLHTFIKIKLIYHGSLASNREDDYTVFLLNDLISLTKEKKIYSLGFVKKGMAETFKKIANINTYHIVLKSPVFINENRNESINECINNIGVFTHDLYRKNIDNQIASALMIDNAIVHIKKNYNFDYFKSQERLQIHSFFNSYNDFLKLLATMDINLYISFSECWGQVITESLALGVPCICADNSGIFDYSDKLRDFLVVKEFDNSNAIFLQILNVFANRKEISIVGLKYMTILNTISDEKLSLFLNT